MAASPIATGVVTDSQGNDKTPLVPLSGLTGKFDDDSYFDPDDAQSALDDFVALLEPWRSAFVSLESLTVRVAKYETALRATVHLKSGHPDWAGNSNAWAEVRKHIVRAYEEAGMDSGQITRLQTNTGAWRSRNGYTVTAIAQHAVATTPNLGNQEVTLGTGKSAKRIKVKDLVADPQPGVVIPKVLRDAMSAQYKAQKSGTGKALAGFKSVPRTFGPPPKGNGNGTGNRNDRTPAKAWEETRGDVGSIAGTEYVEQLRLSLTALDVHYVGEQGKRAEHKGVIKSSRKAMAEALADLAIHAKILSDYIGNNGAGNPTKETLIKHRAEA